MVITSKTQERTTWTRLCTRNRNILRHSSTRLHTRHPHHTKHATYIHPWNKRKQSQVVPPRTQTRIVQSNSERTQEDTPASQEPQTPQRHPPEMNTTNLRTNTIYGQEMQLEKPDNTSRFVSLNINGLRRGNNFQDALEIAEALKVSSVDFWNFQETNVNWRSQCLSQCYDKFKRVYHHARIATSSSIITYRTAYQPGGTMCAVTDNYVGRTIEVGSNKDMGRWSFVRMLGKHGRNI